MIKSYPSTGLDRPRDSRMLRFPESPDNGHMKVTRLLALRTGNLYPQEISLVFIEST
jgi:hypothetical protein